MKIFIDCNACDFIFIRHEIPFVDFVRDPKYADIHLLITDRQTASGGRRFDLNFIGKNQFLKHNFNLVYVSDQSETDEDRRRGITRTIKLGLMPFVAQTDYAQKIEINFDSTKTLSHKAKDYDSWNHWIFNLELEGGFSSDANRKSFDIRTGIEADRITNEWRLENRLSYEYEEENFEDNGEKIISTLKEWELRSRGVKSLNNHWSAGVFTKFLSTTYKNIQFSTDVAPAIEYNFFPWHESIQREITIAYYLGSRYFNYYEPTLFDKTEENLIYNSLRVEFNFIQPWGELYINLESLYYMTLENKYSLKFESDTSLRLSGGFSLYLGIDAEIIHDQIYLRRGKDSLEEILLKRKQLATNYEFFTYLGLRFTFGSIYNNIVNRRL